MNFVIKMTEQEYWDRFLEKFKECLNSGIETYEEKFLTGKFWDVLWRLKDDTSALHKTHDTLAKMEDSFIRLDSYRPVLLIQIWSIKEIYESKLLERIFANFLYLVEINEEYVKHIIYKNRTDSSHLSIIWRNDAISQLSDFYDKSKKLFAKLIIPEEYRKFTEEEAKSKADEFFKYLSLIAQLGFGIEAYVDHLFKGTKRGEASFDYVSISSFQIQDSDLTRQLEIVNDLFKAQFYELIPYKIRLILEYLIKKILKAHKITIKNRFVDNLDLFKDKFVSSTNFPVNQDIERLHNFRKWGNLTAHDTFPAISKQETLDYRDQIVRLIRNLKDIVPNLFNS